MLKKETPKKKLTADQAFHQLQRFCAYQERCHQEVRAKLLELGVRGEVLEEIVAALIGDNFLNEERFARSFVRGKHRFKQWGRVKIEQELKARNISKHCIEAGFSELTTEEYLQTLQNLLRGKNEQMHEHDPFQRKMKLLQLALRKGYESDLIGACLSEIFDGF